MAEMVIEASVQILIEKALALGTDEISLILGVEDDLEELKGSLGMIRKYLDDAANHQVPTVVKSWLDRLENIAYEADHLLDEFQYETLRRKVQIKNQITRRICFSFCFTNPLCFRSKFGHAIRGLNAKLKKLNEQARDFGLQQTLLVSPFMAPVVTETSSVGVEELVLGRDEDVLNIIDMMVNSSEEVDISIFPIVGMGGLGKTTLARLIFNDPKTIKHFDEKIWICISTDFDAKTMFKKILKSLDEKDNLGDLQAITRRLQKLLRDKRYLLILDDLWNDNSHDWECFKSTLRGMSSRRGNSIIATTRSQAVAVALTSKPSYSPSKLSDEQCWSLIKKKAFPTEFETVGKAISRKCGGVPLAANIIGATLRGEREEEWVKILEDGLSGSQTDHVMQILKVSYHRLPSLLLKKCFAYCAIFRKDTEIEKDKLIQLWMAEGFLSGNDMEGVGSNVYDTLLHNSFLQEAEHDEYGNVMHSKMHDLVHDLAIYVSKEDCFNDEEKLHGASHVRYLAVQSLGEESSKIMKTNASYLRTLCLGSSLVDDLFKDLKRLHVLVLSKIDIDGELTSSIGGLIHLRLLDVSYTKISSLPDSLCKLYNLQTLNVCYCRRLERLPNDVHLLFNMRHLILDDFYVIEVPSHIRKWSCLRTLRIFKVGLEEGKRIEELRYLKHLKGKLRVKNLENVKDKEEAMRSDLSGKSSIQELELQWTSGAEGHNEEEVLEGLEPHSNIRSLFIRYFCGDKFPAWTMKMMVSDARSLLDKLVRIYLIYCKGCQEIPTMGHLPSLKVLRLISLRNVKSIGPSFYHPRYRENPSRTSTSSQPLEIPFPALEEFYISDLENLVDWVAPAELTTAITDTTSSKVIGFPKLKILEMVDTPKLKVIPSHDLQSVESLKFHGTEDSLVVNMASNNNLISLRSLSFAYFNLSSCFYSKLIEANQHHLEELAFHCCEGHLTFPDKEEDVDCLPSLKELYIRDCFGLKSIGFASGQVRRLPSLEKLTVIGCPELESVALE